MKISRRRVLKASVVGSVGVAGCTGGGGETTPDETPTPTETETPTPTPQPALYEEGDKGEMLLEVEDFPDGWRDFDTEEWNVGFTNESGGVVVLATMRIYETVERAKKRLDIARQGFGEPNEYPIGDEAFWAERSDNARTYFRDSNAVGFVLSSRESSRGEMVPDPSRSQSYARKMYRKSGDT